MWLKRLRIGYAMPRDRVIQRFIDGPSSACAETTTSVSMSTSSFCSLIWYSAFASAVFSTFPRR